LNNKSRKKIKPSNSWKTKNKKLSMRMNYQRDKKSLSHQSGQMKRS